MAHKKLSLVVVSIVCAFGLILFSALSSHAADFTFQIALFRDPSYCIDVQQGVVVNGTPIQMWPCNGTAAQAWKSTPYKDGSFQLRLKAQPNYCLDYYDSPNPPKTNGGTPLHLWECSNAAKWRATLSNTGSCNYRCILYYTDAYNQMIDLPNNFASAGARLQVWPFNNTTAQFWKDGILSTN